ncbi:MAG: GntR family transcriptional regulator [Chloroflexota bacterium]
MQELIAENGSIAEPIWLGEVPLLNAGGKDSAGEQAYRLLKRLIVTLELPPGTVLNERFLIERLGLHRTPLREALQRLVQERLVVVLPRRGILISEISIGDLQSIFEVRANLEGLCTRLAAQRITPEQVAQLEQLFVGVEAGNDADDVEIDQRFHQLVMRAARNPLLEDMLCRIHALSLRLLYLTKSRMAKVRDTYDDYLAIVRALKSGDAAAAEEASRHHVEAFYQKVRQTL